MARFFDAVDKEEGLFRRASAAQARREGAKARVDDDFANRLAESARHSPWMAGAAHVSLVRAGVAPSSPAYKQASTAAAKQKAKRGFGWHSVGDLVEATADRAGDVVKGGVRALTTALSVPYEETQAMFRTGAWLGSKGVIAAGPPSLSNLGQTLGVLKPDLIETGDTPPSYFSSTGAVAVEQFVRNRGKVDMGDGFFAGGEVLKEQRARARQVKVGGKGVTPGRLIAAQVVEPGRREYDIVSGFLDASLAYADPGVQELKVLGATRKAKKLLVNPDNVGLLQGRRATVLPEVVNNWIDSPQVDRLAEKLAETTSFTEIWHRTKKKVPVDVVARLQRASDPNEIKAIMREAALGGTIREKVGAGPLSELGIGIKRKTSEIRILQGMPGHHVDLEDADKAVETMDRFMRNAKVPSEVIDRRLSDLAVARAGPDRYVAMESIMDSVEDVLRASGADDGMARQMTTMFKNSYADLRRYYVDEIGNNAVVPGVRFDDAGQPIASPHLFVEYLNRTVPLPDARDIRREMSFLAPIFKVPGVRGSVAFLDFAQQSLWKPAVLGRVAWPVRVIGEEQLRLGASGMLSAFHHPLSFLTMAATDSKRTGRLLAKLGVTTGAGAKGVTGEALEEAEDYLQAMSRGTAGFRDTADTIRTQHKRLVTRGEEQFAEAWADEIAQLASDPIASRLARTSVDEVKEWFYRGEGAQIRARLMTEEPRFSARAFADEYIDSVMQRIQTKTGSSPDLLDIVRTGKFGDVRVVGDDARAPKELLAFLRTTADGGVGPAVVKGDLLIHTSGRGNEALARYDAAVEKMFNSLMSKRTNTLSRSPAFKQFYWQRVEEILERATPEAQRKILAAASDAKVNTSKMKALGTGDLTVDQIDVIAKGFALDSTRKLLYDLSDRSQFGDVFRLVFPFAEAWKEILTTWARIGVEQPHVVRRAQQVVQGARGAGFFYTDPQTGEEVFTYPASEWLTDKVLDVPMPLVGSVSGLNLAGTSVFPALGPVIQIPASKLIPNKPSNDWIKEIVLPFGEPDTSKGILASQSPAWMRKLFMANDNPESDRLFGNTVIDVARYLVSTGEYSTRTPEEMDRLLAAATTKARYLYVMRGLTQFAAPTGPRPLAVAEVDGKTVVAQKLLDDFQKMQEEDYDTAVHRFLEKYGENSILFMQAKSRSLAKLPMDEAGNDWVRENPDLVKKYPLVYGFFAPTGGDFSNQAYTRYLKTGESESLSPEENAKLANQTVANMVYYQAKARAGTHKEGVEWLREVRAALEEEFPGFGETLPIKQKAKKEEVIAQLEKAASDPKIADTDLGKALGAYFAARTKALATAKEMGRAGFGTSKDTRYLRDWMREVVDAINTEYPKANFGEVFDMALSREMKDDEPEAEPEDEETE